MQDFFKSIRFKILVAILAILMGFIVMAVYSGGGTSLLSKALSVVTVPIQRAASDISDNVSEFFDKFVNAEEIYQKNKALQEEVNALRKQLADYNKIKHENDQFRDMFGVKRRMENITFEPASVIARNPTERYGSFTIDKGTLNGVSFMDPVMTADGLVGYISEVGTNSAKVITILDTSISVGAYNSSTRDIGIVTGTVDLMLEELCSMEHIARESKVKKGDLILTSGGSVFPKDIIIGHVESVKPSRYGTSLVAVIRPAADPTKVTDVFVVTSFEGQGEE